MEVKVYKTRKEMGEAAGKAVEAKIADVAAKQDEVRIVFAAAPSQNEVLAYLKESTAIPWHKVVAFHMDEYVGLPAGASQTFASYLKSHLFDGLALKERNFIDGNNGETEAVRYAALIKEKPIDIVCLGIGENGHIAFNDPAVADFNDPEIMKEVKLDQVCRRQQVNDGCFESLNEVPTHALTLTIPAIMGGRYLYCAVPGKTKRKAVYETLNGPIDPACPASILKKHANCTLFLDQDSFGANE